MEFFMVYCPSGACRGESFKDGSNHQEYRIRSCCFFLEGFIFRELNLKHFFTNSTFTNDLP